MPVRAVVTLVLAGLLLASVWVNPLASAAARYNQQASVTALSIYATLRTLSATLSVLKDADVEGSVLFGSIAASPGQVLEPVTHTLERFADIMFVVALVSATLALLLGPAAGIGAAAAGAALALLLAHRLGRPALPPWLRRGARAAAALGIALAVVVPAAYGAAFWAGERLTRAATTEAVAVLERVSARSPELPAGEPRPGVLDRLGDVVAGDAVGRFMATADDLLGATVDLTVAYLLKLLVLPTLLALAVWWFTRAVLRGAAAPV